MQRVLVLVLIIVLLFAGCAMQPPGDLKDYDYAWVNAFGSHVHGYILKDQIEKWEANTLTGKVRVYGESIYIIDAEDIVSITID